MPDPICDECGRPASEHHEFQPISPPPGCVCPIDEWGNARAIPRVCGEFKDTEGDGLCDTCEHEERCHA